MDHPNDRNTEECEFRLLYPEKYFECLWEKVSKVFFIVFGIILLMVLLPVILPIIIRFIRFIVRLIRGVV